MSVPIRACLLLALARLSTGEVTETLEEEISPCLEEDEMSELRALEGEGLRLHAKVPEADLADTNVTDPRWYRNGTEEIFSSEGQRIHQHGSILFFLPLLLDDSEHYYSYGRASPDRCFLFKSKVIVLPVKPHPPVLFPPVRESFSNIKIRWPDRRLGKCEGNFSWYRNFSVLPSETKSYLFVHEATAADEAIYTCVCTWTHNQRAYNTSASRWLEVPGPLAYFTPIIITPANGSTETAVIGSIKNLTCSAHCGINIEIDCDVRWRVNEQKPDALQGYHENHSRERDVTSNKWTVFKSVLTIDRVSAQHFRSTFQCIALTTQKNTVTVLFLKPEASLLLPLVGGMCMLLLAGLAALAVRHYAIDLALFCRWLLRSHSHPEDGKVYDAYVAYQRQRLDQTTEERLALFVTRVLPNVLENQCGLRLFIHGRDNLPGEDCMELAERCIRQSRRLMVILTPTSGSGVKGPGAAEQYDWQLGLHYALLQSGMTVILIQLGDMSYAHLPPTLQLLIRSSAPLRWRGATVATSAFWKRVRYLMPAAPASKRGHLPREVPLLADRP